MSLGPCGSVEEAASRKVASQLDRIEAKLDALIEALAEDDIPEPALTLDGQDVGGERDTNREL